jgi:hypothetical protein
MNAIEKLAQDFGWIEDQDSAFSFLEMVDSEIVDILDAYEDEYSFFPYDECPLNPKQTWIEWAVSLVKQRAEIHDVLYPEETKKLLSLF